MGVKQLQLILLATACLSWQQVQGQLSASIGAIGALIGLLTDDGPVSDERLNKSINDQRQCRACLADGHTYLSRPTNSGGKCCDKVTLDDTPNRCEVNGRRSDVTRSDMPFWLCPNKYQVCGEQILFSSTVSQIYRLKAAEFSRGQSLCNHQLTFPIIAGLFDIVTVRFGKIPPNGFLYVSVGTSFEEAQGTKLGDADQDTTIKTSFPNNVYITLEMTSFDDESLDDFQFEFFYSDQQATQLEEDREVLEGKGPYVLFEPEDAEHIEKAANLLWVYILGGVAVLVLAIGIFCFFCRVRDQQKIQLAVMKDREEGIVKTWGVRRNPIVQDKDMEGSGTPVEEKSIDKAKQDDDLLGRDQTGQHDDSAQMISSRHLPDYTNSVIKMNIDSLRRNGPQGYPNMSPNPTRTSKEFDSASGIATSMPAIQGATSMTPPKQGNWD